MYISYSGMNTYKTCPLQYKFRYITKEQVSVDPRSSMFGSTIGKIMEWFYERRLWEKPNPILASLACVDEAIDLISSKENFDQSLDPAFISLLRSDLLTYIPTSIDIVRSNGFLTSNSRAEEDLTVTYGNERYGKILKLGGRSDFIHSKDRLDVWILDGKGSRHRDKYADPNQLIWYAVLHYIKYHVAPTRLGFIFWKFPDNPVKWIDYDETKMRNLLDDTFRISNKIESGEFEPTPSDSCNLCSYKGKCDVGKKYIASRRVGDRVENSIFLLES